MLIRFQEITRKRLLKGNCHTCERKCQRTISVTHTVNPFNTNADGAVKSVAEVTQSVMAELAAKIAAGLECRTCEYLRWQRESAARVAEWKAKQASAPETVMASATPNDGERS